MSLVLIVSRNCFTAVSKLRLRIDPCTVPPHLQRNTLTQRMLAQSCPDFRREPASSVVTPHLRQPLAQRARGRLLLQDDELWRRQRLRLWRLGRFRHMKSLRVHCVCLAAQGRQPHIGHGQDSDGVTIDVTAEIRVWVQIRVRVWSWSGCGSESRAGSRSGSSLGSASGFGPGSGQDTAGCQAQGLAGEPPPARGGGSNMRKTSLGAHCGGRWGCPAAARPAPQSAQTAGAPLHRPSSCPAARRLPSAAVHRLWLDTPEAFCGRGHGGHASSACHLWAPWSPTKCATPLTAASLMADLVVSVWLSE